MLDELLPSVAVAVETADDAPEVMLFPEEREVIAGAADKRRREFTTVRGCARRGLAQLGVAPAPILPGVGGKPVWPAGIVGSMTHCTGYGAAAVSRSEHLSVIGVDAEPNARLPDGVDTLVVLRDERRQLHPLSRLHPYVSWDRLLFSMKESTYKAWFPLTGRRIGFRDVLVVLDLPTKTFTSHLLVQGPVIAGRELAKIHGRWLVRQDLVVTATFVR